MCVCVCTQVHTRAIALKWKNFGKSICSFHHIGQESHTGGE